MSVRVPGGSERIGTGPAGQASTEAGLNLRPYQVAAIEAIRERFRAGDRATLLVLPTGTGKTVVFADIARRVVDRGGRALVLAHRGELLHQAAAKLRGVGVEPGIEKAEQRAGAAGVVVASVQTLRGERLANFDPGAFRLLVIDEAHHATAAGYRAIVAHFASAHVLGVTATPDRLDGQGLGQVFDSVAYRYDLRRAIRDGWLAPIRARRITVASVNLDKVRTRAGDLHEGDLANVFGAERALHEVAVPLLELAGERPTIAFAVNVRHAQALARVLNRYQPGSARALSGAAPADERDETVRAFRAGRFRYLVNCQLFTEGFDAPEVACVAIARPTKSRALYTQMVGRGTRLADGKADCLVLDFVGNSARHRLITTVDVLAGTDVPAHVLERARARADADPRLSLVDVIDEVVAERSPVRSQAQIRAVARFMAEDVDPFVEAQERQLGSWAAELATEKQRACLARNGLETIPAALTKGEASRIIAGLDERRARGLATYRQTRLLKRHGVDARQMTFDEADARIAQLLGRAAS